MLNERRVITSLQHPLVKHLVKLRQESAYRYEQQKLVLDGLKLIHEVPTLITKLLFTPAYADSIDKIDAEKWEVSEGIIHKISGMSSPEGVVAEIQMPQFTELNLAKRVVALDGINEPGNIGALMRTALALGWETICFLPGCCDPFNEKALRAARGAHFKLKMTRNSHHSLKEWVLSENVQALVADLKGTPPVSIERAPKRLLVLGNEAHGPTIQSREFCNPVTIPMPGEMESLNVAVAGGILLYLLNVS